MVRLLDGVTGELVGVEEGTRLKQQQLDANEDRLQALSIQVPASIQDRITHSQCRGLEQSGSSKPESVVACSCMSDGRQRQCRLLFVNIVAQVQDIDVSGSTVSGFRADVVDTFSACKMNRIGVTRGQLENAQEAEDEATEAVRRSDYPRSVLRVFCGPAANAASALCHCNEAASSNCTVRQQDFDSKMVRQEERIHLSASCHI